MAKSIERARALRHDQTEAEKALWQRIRNGQLGCKFRRHMPVGIYTVDFACLELKLIIEVDGGQHAGSEKDEVRTKFLNSLGFQVIRFWNNDILSNIDGVLTVSEHALKTRREETSGPWLAS